ncbi:MAG: hypothetical protein HQM08_01340 [Candidatus Riflebacteria bacterium]|nr:hypothetical protein [Candidatus Riflebacteria bacterium]
MFNNMYIRETLTRNKKTGTTYKIFRLVEAIRTHSGPRQRVILNLGTLDLSKVQRKILARILEARISGQKSLFEENTALVKIAEEALQNLDYRKTLEQGKPQESATELASIDLKSLKFSENRSVGPEILGHFAQMQ